MLRGLLARPSSSWGLAYVLRGSRLGGGVLAPLVRGRKGEFRDLFGSIDRVVVNAGLGKGQPLGTGRFDANKATAETNFIGALAQTEAAAAIFRRQHSGHLVMVSSFSALRGMPAPRAIDRTKKPVVTRFRPVL